MRQWIIYFLFAFASAAFAEDEQTYNKLTLDQAIINVLENNPLLKAADYEAKAAAARIRSAQLTPAFHASIGFENFSNSDRDIGNDNLESTLRLSKILELGDKTTLRGKLVQNKAILLHTDQDAKRLDLLAETAKRFIQVITNQEQIIISKDSLDLAKHTKKIIGQRVKAGKSPNAELRRAKIALARKELELEHTKHELLTSRLKLATLWGKTQPRFSTAEANLFEIKPIIPFETLVQLLERNPELIRYATEKRLAETRIQLARSKRQPDIEISGGVRHFKTTDDTGLVLSLRVPLGSSSRSAPHVEEAEMLNLRDPHIYEQRRLNLHATLFEVHQEIKHAIDAVKILRETIIPQAKHALKDYEKEGYAVE